MRLLLSLSIVLIIVGCSSGGGGGVSQVPEPDEPVLPAEPTALERELSWLHDKMKNEYLWYDETPDLDYLSFPSAEELLEAMIVEGKDRFSNIQTLERSTANQTATSVTYGFRTIGRDFMQVTRVYNGSSADDAGVKRADRLTRVADINITDEASVDAALEFARNVSEGSTLEFEFEREGLDAPIIATLEAREVSRQTVDFVGTKLDRNGDGLGYLYIYEFRSTNNKTDNELRNAFRFFSERNVRSLIIDLRDNQGGSIWTINTLGSLILGNVARGAPFIDYRFSDRGEAIFASEGFTTGYDLKEEEHALGIERVHVIASARTCSASEILINSLRPYVDVQISGVTTCGKPYGFYGRQFEEKSVLWAINFQSDNASGQGGWVDGLDPTCNISDYQVFPYGDMRDQHLASAEKYLETGTCTTPAVVAADSQARGLAQDRRGIYHPEWQADPSVGSM